MLCGKSVMVVYKLLLVLFNSFGLLETNPVLVDSCHCLENKWPVGNSAVRRHRLRDQKLKAVIVAPKLTYLFCTLRREKLL